MNINYGDTGMIITYIQMFLKEYYSKFLKVDNVYSKDVQENLIKYIDSPDSVTMREIIDLIRTEYGNDILLYFKKYEKIDEIYYESKKECNNIVTIKSEDTKNSVDWLNKNINIFSEFLYKYGWKISNYNYCNENNKCDLTISKINKNVLPKDALIDLVNMFDKKYTETSYGIIDNSDKYYFSTLYNFELRNYESSIYNKSGESNKIPLFKCILPLFGDYSNKYKIYKDVDKYKISNFDSTEVKDFNGLNTFTCNLNNTNEDQSYIVYIKRPSSSNIPDVGLLTEYYAFVCFSKLIGTNSNIDYTNNSSIEEMIINPFSFVLEDYNEEYFILRIDIPKNTVSNDYKLCISIPDYNNEIDTIFCYKLDRNHILNKSDISEVTVTSLREDDLNKIYDGSNVISPERYYDNPFIIHEKLISYILEVIVHEYSREEDIILIQKLANKLGFNYNSYELGVYSDRLKNFISKLQSNNHNKDGEDILYGKGYVDPDTESIMILRGDY